MASSSSSAAAKPIVSSKLYDAFISHRGPDVKHTLGKKLYDLLQGRGCNSFLDCEEIKPGDCITTAIHNAICSSRVQIAIFSERFAESSWCLDEVVLMQQTDALFIPIFYGVQPRDLRHIDNKKSRYAKEFSDYQSKGRYIDKLDGWKRALERAAGNFGYELDINYQEDLLEKIVSHVVKVVQEKLKSTPLHVAKYPVGLDELVQKFEECYSKIVGAGMAGIFGLGGSGKTTLAKALVNKKSSGYDKCCFLSNVRESNARGELHRLQGQLLHDLFLQNEEIRNVDGLQGQQEIRNVDEGIGKLKDHFGRARHQRFLIVMDDIDHQDQLDALLPEGMLGCRSLVIITTRDQSVLRGVDARYKMERMNRDRARDLFCKHAFRISDPPTAYQELVERFVEFCGGLPLSLTVLGAHVYGRDAYYWNLELEKVKKIQPWDIMKRLKISFDGLDGEEKQIFIDIACLFYEKISLDLKYQAIIIWKACGWSAEHAVQTLQDKCLIESDSYGFRVHDHLRDLGRVMADELGPPRLWQPELRRSMEEKGLKQILTETKGRCFYSFEDSTLDQRYIKCFIADTDLILLTFRQGPLASNIPSWIPLRKLHYLDICMVKDMWSSFEEQLERHGQTTFELRTLYIELCGSEKLPNIIKLFSHLEKLEIENSLEETDTTSFVQSIKQLSKLRLLHLSDPTLELNRGMFRGNLDLSKGRDCATSSCMDSLETIILCGLQNIFKLIISDEVCPKLQTLEILTMDNLKEIELKSFLNVPDRSRVEHIQISECPKLQSVQGVEKFPELKRLLIEVPDNNNAWVSNYIGGLRRWSVKNTIFLNRAASAWKLNPGFFFNLIDVETVDEIQRGEYTLQMKSSPGAITIYSLLVRADKFGEIIFESEERYDSILCGAHWLITIILTQDDSEVLLRNGTIKRGFKVIIRSGEEGKSFIVMQRIVDQLYREVTKNVDELKLKLKLKRKRKPKRKRKRKQNFYDFLYG